MMYIIYEQGAQGIHKVYTRTIISFLYLLAKRNTCEIDVINRNYVFKICRNRFKGSNLYCTKSLGRKETRVGEIARGAIDSPQSFTAKILQQLTIDNGIVSSARGPNGGFYLTNKAKKQPVRKMLDLLGENDLLEKCVLGLKQCSEEKPCPMHSGYRSIKKDLIRLFETKTIQDLATELEGGDTYKNPKRRSCLNFS